MGQVDAPVHLVASAERGRRARLTDDTPIAYITQTTLSVDDTRGDHRRAEGAVQRRRSGRTSPKSAMPRRTARPRCASCAADGRSAARRRRGEQLEFEPPARDRRRDGAAELSRRRWRRRRSGLVGGRERRSASPPARRRPTSWSMSVIAALRRLAPGRGRASSTGVEETLEFGLPRELRDRCTAARRVAQRTSDHGLAARRQLARIGAYTVKQHLKGGKYPLVLMLEPLLRCNLACPGCGKIDYPDAILNQRLSYQQCMDAIDECGAPAVSIAGRRAAAPPRHAARSSRAISRRRSSSSCAPTRCCSRRRSTTTSRRPSSPGRSISMATRACTTMRSIRTAPTRSRSRRSSWPSRRASASRSIAPCSMAPIRRGWRRFFDEMKRLGVEITISPGYSYERAADQEHFLTARATKNFFRDVFRRGDGGKAWDFTNSPLFLDFLAGNQTYECTPWSMPLRTVFGWQKPCYLVGEGYVQTFAELMQGTDWDQYGVGKYEKCSNCMVHCGFEGTAATDAIRHPLKMVKRRPQGHPHRRPDGARHRPVERAPGRGRVLEPCRDVSSSGSNARIPKASSASSGRPDRSGKGRRLAQLLIRLDHRLQHASWLRSPPLRSG